MTRWTPEVEGAIKELKFQAYLTVRTTRWTLEIEGSDDGGVFRVR